MYTCNESWQSLTVLSATAKPSTPDESNLRRAVDVLLGAPSFLRAPGGGKWEIGMNRARKKALGGNNREDVIIYITYIHTCISAYVYARKQIFIQMCMYIQLIYLRLVVIPNGHSLSRDVEMTKFTLFGEGEQVGKT